MKSLLAGAVVFQLIAPSNPSAQRLTPSVAECRVTIDQPGGYGDQPLSTFGLWPDGNVVFRPGGPGFVTSDGALGMKFGWQRAESREDKQKRLEATYLAEARKVSSLFPDDELTPFKPYPDFVTADRSLGIEVTELCDPDGRSDGARLALVVPRAKQMYMSQPDAPPLSVAAAMAPQADEMRVDELTQALADFVYRHRHQRGEVRDERLPRGWCHIAIFDPFRNQPADGEWPVTRAIHTVLGAREMVDARIAEKNARVVDYRTQVSEVWLLIVNNRFLGPGEIYLRSDLIVNERFGFAFDKVLVFLRDIGGGGEVVELNRAP